MVGFRGSMRRVGRRAAGWAVLVVILSGWSYAQSAADPDLAAAIAGKRKVRVLTQSGQMVLRRPEITREGLISQAGRGGPGDPRVVPWADINGVQVRRSGAGKGAIIGAGIGTGLGLAFGLACTRDCTGWMDMFCEATAGQVVLVTAIGGAGGGLLGAAIGALTGSWRTVYTRTKPFQKLPRVSIAPAPGGGLIFSLSLSL